MFSAPTHRLFPRDLPHNRADAVRPSQDHRQSPAPLRRPHQGNYLINQLLININYHQGVPLPNPPRRQVPPQLSHHPSRHQTRQSSRKLQLCSQNL